MQRLKRLTANMHARMTPSPQLQAYDDICYTPQLGGVLQRANFHATLCFCLFWGCGVLKCQFSAHGIGDPSSYRERPPAKGGCLKGPIFTPNPAFAFFFVVLGCLKCQFSHFFPGGGLVFFFPQTITSIFRIFPVGAQILEKMRVLTSWNFGGQTSGNVGQRQADVGHVGRWTSDRANARQTSGTSGKLLEVET